MGQAGPADPGAAVVTSAAAPDLIGPRKSGRDLVAQTERRPPMKAMKGQNKERFFTLREKGSRRKKCRSSGEK